MKRILALPGDGIGPEVVAEATRVPDAVKLDLVVEHDLVGGASIDAHGVCLTDAMFDKARTADAALIGAVGGPEWRSAPYDRRPEVAIIGPRKRLDLFANFRPSKVLEAQIDA